MNENLPAIRTQDQGLFQAAMTSLMRDMARHPLIYGPNGSPVQPVISAGYKKFSRESARREGSIKTWIPRRLFGVMSEALEREQISDRASDLVNNNGYAAGAVQTVAVTTIGPGLTPHPTFEPEALGLSKDEARAVQTQMRGVWQAWAPWADAAERMSFGAIQFQAMRNLMQFGEYLALLPMRADDPARPYSLAVQLLHPSRLATPGDKSQGNVIDGVEIGPHGQPLAYWIKKVDPANREDLRPNVSTNFLRVPARIGWRWQVLHGFCATEPEQVRGVSPFAPIMKLFKDLNDYLNAELVSNIVTAAFSLFIETGAGVDPLYPAGALATMSETGTNADGESQTVRYQEMEPGQIMYGNTGEKPHPIAANRPGSTFDPFIRLILKAISSGLGVPYPILFKDMDAMSFAGYRGAMLEAWRVFVMLRSRLGEQFCAPVYGMLMEEAWLRGEIAVNDFYANRFQLCRTEWRGYPKGDIEPIKQVQANIAAIDARLKTRTAAVAEDGGDFYAVVETLEDEQRLLEEKGLLGGSAAPAGAAAGPPGSQDIDDDQAEAEAFMERMSQ
jgi:lambda family phage portal protein